MTSQNMNGTLNTQVRRNLSAKHVGNAVALKGRRVFIYMYNKMHMLLYACDNFPLLYECVLDV